jgi:hypothetical protein
MTKSTQKKASNKQENIVIEFLGRYLYNKLYPGHEIVTEDDALPGVDIIASTLQGDEHHDIQVQATPRYINHPNPTFSFTVMYNDADGNVCIGDFIDPNVNAQVCVLAWINSAKTNNYGYLSEAEDINELEVLFIDRRDLKAYANESIYDNAMYNTANKMRAQRTRSLFVSNALYLYYTETLADKPVHLVFKKYALEELAYMRLLVTKQGIKNLA